MDLNDAQQFLSAFSTSVLWLCFWSHIYSLYCSIYICIILFQLSVFVELQLSLCFHCGFSKPHFQKTKKVFHHYWLTLSRKQIDLFPYPWFLLLQLLCFQTLINTTLHRRPGIRRSIHCLYINLNWRMSSCSVDYTEMRG